MGIDLAKRSLIIHYCPGDATDPVFHRRPTAEYSEAKLGLQRANGREVMKRLAYRIVLLGALPSAIQGQEIKKIQDNSYLVEEAYNQEAGVVQHIQTLLYDRRSAEWFYSFTQEWPVPNETHQLSYTVPLTHLNDPTSTIGVGDVMLNYRYQAILSQRLAFAPRVSLILPTGYYKNETGTGAVGFQVNLPLSVELSDKWVTHWNVGATYTSQSRERAGATANTTGTNVGASVIYLLSENFNLMFEAVQTRTGVVQPDGHARHDMQTLVSPGFRYAINFDSGLQIVSGLAVPVGVGSSSGDHLVLLYLSFEHPFR